MIRRTYGCNKCSHEWTMLHDNSDEWCKRCPECGAKANWSPQPLSIKSNRSRAVDLTQKIMETEYGHTNFKDNTREGEIAAMGLKPQTTSEKEAMVRQVAESTRQLAEGMAGTIRPETQAAVRDASQIFKADNGQLANAAANPQAKADDGQMLAMAKMGVQQAKQLNGGKSPMEMLHGGLKSGKINPLKTSIMARAPLGN